MSQGRIFNIIFSSVFDSLPQSYQPISGSASKMPSLLLRRFSSMGGRRNRGPIRGDQVEDDSVRNPEPNGFNGHHSSVPEPIPGRPLRSERPSRNERPLPQQSHRFPQNDRGRSQSGKDQFSNKFENERDFGFGGTTVGEMEKKFSHNSTPEFLQREKKRDDPSENKFLEKFKLGVDNKEKTQENETPQLSEEKGGDDPVEPPQEANEIFKKMKETGLIPNAVAMLDGLCKDGLVQEAMKLFGLMRQKGTIPEVVIYTAVVEGFYKANKVDDARRIFRKMQTNGITPNAFSYSIMVQGLYKCQKLEDAIEFCEEMLEAGHSPNMTTFVGLVDGVCKEKGVEEAQTVIGRLRQKGFFLDEKVVREHLDRRGSFNSKVREAIFGTKTSQRPL